MSKALNVILTIIFTPIATFIVICLLGILAGAVVGIIGLGFEVFMLFYVKTLTLIMG